ncbi:MAG: DUF211 domain-containing protein, partial [archaeon]
DAVKKIISDNGAVIHSIDRVVVGKEKIVEIGEGIVSKS